MRKFALFVALVAFMGQARGDVTGIALSRTGSSTADSNVFNSSITFSTSTGGASFLLTQIKLYTTSSNTVSFSLDGYITSSEIAPTITDGIGTFNFVGAEFNQTLAANTEYTLSVGLSDFLYGTSTGSIQAGVSPLNFSGSQNIDHTTDSTDYYTKFELYASVPEPGTMILTGTAMVGGMVGAWWKRRQQKSQTPLVVG